ncbi:hypothetical protein GGX14DRAFT_669502 [Mycena pura]|uniref:Uncharacterized protein n=1 Tax=Mycena pura TaxID=153505 RepID=A0AAD6VV71_9AGAR|nr:hypothetical protein GGX14DRAFT_669502 [Mycena pura]
MDSSTHEFPDCKDIEPPDQVRHLRQLGVLHFARSLRLHGIPPALLPSEHWQCVRVRVIRPSRWRAGWESTRIKSYGIGKFIKEDEFDVEVIAGR